MRPSKPLALWPFPGRAFSMKTRVLAISMAALVALTIAGAGEAATLKRLTAINNGSNTPAFMSSFWIDFEDLNNDGLLSGLNEVVATSGAYLFPDRSNEFFPTLVTIANVTGLTVAPVGSGWTFGNARGDSITTSALDFDYVFATSPSRVPLPASGLMLIAGLAGGAFLRRRRT